MQTAFGLGVHRPGRGDGEPGFDQAAGQRVPCSCRLVREHDGHDAVRLQDAALFLENGRHATLIVAAGEVLSAALLPGELSRIGDCFTIFVGQVADEQLRIEQPRRALEPDVEEVRQLRIHDVVVVGRVHHDAVDGCILEEKRIG